MSFYGIQKGIQDSGAAKSPKFKTFYKLFAVFVGLFVILNLLITYTHLLDRIISQDVFVLVMIYGGLALVVVLIIFAIRYLRSSKPVKEGSEPREVNHSGLHRVTGWKAIALFFGIVVVVAVLSIILGSPKF